MSIIQNMYSVTEAAELIGISTGRLRQMIIHYNKRSPNGRAEPRGNECKAVPYKGKMFPKGYIWQISKEEIERLSNVNHGTGRPRRS